MSIISILLIVLASFVFLIMFGAYIEVILQLIFGIISICIYGICGLCKLLYKLIIKIRSSKSATSDIQTENDEPPILTQELFCSKYKLTKDQFLGLQEIYGTLSLNDIDILPDGFKPIVIGDIEFSSNSAIPIGFGGIWTGVLKLSDSVVSSTLPIDNETKNINDFIIKVKFSRYCRIPMPDLVNRYYYGDTLNDGISMKLKSC